MAICFIVEGTIFISRYFYRPALADDVKVGFFNLDRACQTEQTDIIQLKEMTDVLLALIKVSLVYCST